MFHAENSEDAEGRGGIFVTLIAGDLTERVIGLAITVHRHTGPGLLESVYEQCLTHELQRAAIAFERKVSIPLVYRGSKIADGFRADFVVAERLILEIKSLAVVLPVHHAQLLTYLRLSGLQIGLLMNFNEPRLIDGLHRVVLSRSAAAGSPANIPSATPSHGLSEAP